MFSFRRTFEKHIKTIEDQGRKQIEALKVLKPDAQQLTIKDVIPEDQLHEKTKSESENIKKDRTRSQ